MSTENTTPDTNLTPDTNAQNSAPETPSAFGLAQPGTAPTDGAARPPVVSAIGKRLSARQSNTEVVDENKPLSTDSKPFDVSTLSREQLANLKAMLAATPDDVAFEGYKSTYTLRRVDGKYVILVGNVFNRVVEDVNTMAKIQRPYIKFRLYGETYAADEWEELPYDEFMDSERAVVTHVSVDEHVTWKNEGMVRQRDTGLMVARRAKLVSYTYKVKLPEGDIIDVPGSAINA